MNVHGQTLIGTGLIPFKEGDASIRYRPEASQAKRVQQYLESKNLGHAHHSQGWSAYPFLSDVVVDHFLAAVAKFMRDLLAALARKDPALEQAFGAGLPLPYLKVLAGEGTMHVLPLKRVEIRFTGGDNSTVHTAGRHPTCDKTECPRGLED